MNPHRLTAQQTAHEAYVMATRGMGWEDLCVKLNRTHLNITEESARRFVWLAEAHRRQKLGKDIETIRPKANPYTAV